MINFFTTKEDIKKNELNDVFQQALVLVHQLQQGIFASDLVKLKEYAKNTDKLIGELNKIEDTSVFNRVVDFYNGDIDTIVNTINKNLKNYDVEFCGKKIIDYNYDEIISKIDNIQNQIDELILKINNNFTKEEKTLIELFISDEIESIEDLNNELLFTSEINNLRYSDYPKELAYHFIFNIINNNLFDCFEEWSFSREDEYLLKKIEECLIQAFKKANQNLEFLKLSDEKQTQVVDNIKIKILHSNGFSSTCSELFLLPHYQIHEITDNFLNDFGITIQLILIDEIKNAIITSDDNFVNYLTSKNMNYDDICINTLKKLKGKEYEI